MSLVPGTPSCPPPGRRPHQRVRPQDAHRQGARFRAKTARFPSTRSSPEGARKRSPPLPRGPPVPGRRHGPLSEVQSRDCRAWEPGALKQLSRRSPARAVFAVCHFAGHLVCAASKTRGHPVAVTATWPTRKGSHFCPGDPFSVSCMSIVVCGSSRPTKHRPWGWTGGDSARPGLVWYPNGPGV